MRDRPVVEAAGRLAQGFAEPFGVRTTLVEPAWRLMTGALRQRLADVEAQRDNAATADFEDSRATARS